MRTTVEWQLTPDRWAAFVAHCPDATFFHRPGWYQACAEALGYQLDTALFRFESGREALLPLAVRPQFKGLVRQALSGLENGYGGLVSPTPLSDDEIEDAYTLMRRRYADWIVIGNPHGRYAMLPAGGEYQGDTTHVLPIVEPTAQVARMNATRSKHVKRARKDQFALEVHTRLTAEDTARFYALYERHSAAWEYQKWRRDESFFRALLRHAGDDLALFLAYADGELAGFRLLGLGGPVVMDLYLATNEAFEKRHVGPLLVGEPLAWCYAQGYRLFDFQPSGQLEGVKAYKASFGALPCAHGQVQQRGRLAGWLSPLRGGRSPRIAPAAG